MYPNAISWKRLTEDGNEQLVIIYPLRKSSDVSNMMLIETGWLDWYKTALFNYRFF